MNEHRKKHLEKEKTRYEQELDSISIQIGFHNPASTEYLELDRKHKFICSKIAEIESELSSYQHSSLTNNQRGNIFDKNIQNIDFKEPIDIIDKIIKKFDRKGVSAFFLIENTKATKGNLLVDYIRDDLSKKSKHSKHYQINLIANNIVDEQSLLSAIANFISKSDSDTQIVDNLQDYAINIIDKITNSLQVGSLVFFELTDWDSLKEKQDSLLCWFMQYFWIPEGSRV
ncbi:MAG: hypothetical protein F6K65_19940, partial [Moorea sp. SIO3C2]|nr:hypothetical protein [Moorena sp. SIO3C2]